MKASRGRAGGLGVLDETSPVDWAKTPKEGRRTTSCLVELHVESAGARRTVGRREGS